MVRIPLDWGVLSLAVSPGTVMAAIYDIGNYLDVTLNMFGHFHILLSLPLILILPNFAI
jgi:Sec-independent protein secretion pathway component TatC